MNLMSKYRMVVLSKNDYAKNARLYLVSKDGSYKEGDCKGENLEKWFRSDSNAKPHLFRNGSTNSLEAALEGAQRIIQARGLNDVMLVYAPIGVRDYIWAYRDLNPPVDAVVLEFARLTHVVQKKGVIWTHSFAGPSTTIALSNLFRDKVEKLKHHSVAPAFFHANEYKAGLLNTKVKTTIYQASGDTVSRSGSFTQNPFSYSRGRAHDASVAGKSNITFVPLMGGDHPLAEYLNYAQLRKGHIADE